MIYLYFLQSEDFVSFHIHLTAETANSRAEETGSYSLQTMWHRVKIHYYAGGVKKKKNPPAARFTLTPATFSA